MQNHALIPLDGSSVAEQAIEHAVNVVGAGGKITLLTVVELPDLWAYQTPLLGKAVVPDLHRVENLLQEREAEIRRDLLSQSETYLQHLAQRLAAHDIQVEISVQTDVPPADAIIQTAKDHKVNFICMISRDRSALSRRLFGGVAASVLSNAPCPVLIIPYKQEETPAKRLSA